MHSNPSATHTDRETTPQTKETLMHHAEPKPTTTRLTTPFDFTHHRSHAMPTTTEIQTQPKPFDLTHHRSHAMPTTTPNAVPSRATRPTTTTKEIPMTADHSFQPTLTPSLVLVHSASAANGNEPQPSPTRPHLTLVPEEPTPLRASQVKSVAEEELAFFFTSSNADDQTWSADDDEWNANGDTWSTHDEAAVRARQVIGGWIATLSDRDQDALSLYFDREPWPTSIKREEVACSGGYALLLALASPYNGQWTNRPCRPAHLWEIRVQLESAVEKHGPRVLGHLARQAEWSFTTALRAYIHARGRAPSVLAGMHRASCASEDA